MFRIAICEDEEIQRQYEIQMIEKWAVKHGRRVSTDSFVSAEQFLCTCEEQDIYDVLILDIQMGKMNGMELAETLRERGMQTNIIFMTGVADYALKGYEVGAIRYILKPVKEEQFFLVLDEVYERSKQIKKDLFLLEQGGTVSKIKYSEIVYFEARGHYVYMCLMKSSMEWKASFSSVAAVLPENRFFLLRRGLYVNLEQVQSITRTDCILSTGEALPVARNRYKELNQAFIDFYTHS